MTVSNYITTPELRAYIKDPSFLDESVLENACNSASREIDSICGRYFYQQTETQYFSPDVTDLWTVHFDDMDVATSSGLTVNIETGNDGTYATPLTVNVDFILEPINQSSNGINPWPFTSMRSVTGRIFPIKIGPFWRDTVKVVATFGWPGGVPAPVKQATFVQAAFDYAIAAQPLGERPSGLGVKDNPVMMRQLSPYMKATTGAFGFA